MRAWVLMLVCSALSVAPAQAQAPTTAPASQTASDLATLLEGATRGEFQPIRDALARERDPDRLVVLQAALAAGRLEWRVHADPRLHRIARGNDAGLRQAALSVIAGSAFGDGAYAVAARAGAALVPLLRAAGRGSTADELERMTRVATLIGSQPAQRTEGPVAHEATPLRYDLAGLPRIDLGVNGRQQEAVFDTGANLSVLSRSAAERLGVRILDERAAIGNSVQSTVDARIGIADRFTIAGTTLRHVPFLVIEDASLSFGPAGAYKIDAIIGLPVMRALGRFRLEPAARRLSVEAPQPFDVARQNMHFAGNDLFVDARIGDHTAPLHFDSGANRTSLGARFAAAHPDLVSNLPRREQMTAGAGGAASGQAATWSNPPILVNGKPIGLDAVTIALPDGSRELRNHGTIGSDIFRRFRSHSIDLQAMRLELGEALPAPAR